MTERTCAQCGARIPADAHHSRRYCDDHRPVTRRQRDIPCAGGCGRFMWRGRGTLPVGEAMCRRCRASRRVQQRSLTLRARRIGRAPRTCHICQSEYVPTYGRQRACRDCNATLRQRKPTSDSSVIPWAQCLTCREWFIARRKKTCGKQRCSSAYQRHSVLSGTSVTAKCLMCGRWFKYTSSTRPKVFCSPLCSKRSARQNRKKWGSHKARAVRYGVAYEQVNRLTVYKRDGWTCGLCGDPIDPSARWPDQWCASLDHIVPLSKGGGHLYSNVQAAHWWCNTMKGTDETFDLHAA